MMITFVGSKPGVELKQADLQKIKPQPGQYSSYLNQLNADKLEINKPNNIIAFRQKGRITNVVSFTGLKDPTQPAIQMRVKNVRNYQKGEGSVGTFINKLADSTWKDGDKL